MCRAGLLFAVLMAAAGAGCARGTLIHPPGEGSDSGAEVGDGNERPAGDQMSVEAAADLPAGAEGGSEAAPRDLAVDPPPTGGTCPAPMSACTTMGDRMDCCEAGMTKVCVCFSVWQCYDRGGTC